jgi:hypothetical protein
MSGGGLISARAAADALGIRVQQLRKLVAKGAVAYIDLSVGKARRSIRFHPDDITALIQRRLGGSASTVADPAVVAVRAKKEAVIARARPSAKEAAALRRRPPFVYFIRSGPFIKIGTTRNLRHRLNNIQTSHPTPLSLAGSVAGDARLERELHRRFAPLRVNGEWFREVDELAVYVANLKTGA